MLTDLQPRGTPKGPAESPKTATGSEQQPAEKGGGGGPEETRRQNGLSPRKVVDSGPTAQALLETLPTRSQISGAAQREPGRAAKAGLGRNLCGSRRLPNAHLRPSGHHRDLRHPRPACPSSNQLPTLEPGRVT